MARKKTSVIWSIPKEELQNILDCSNSVVDVLKKFNLDPYNGNHKTINERVKLDNLCLKKLNENRKTASIERSKSKKLDDKYIFCEGSNYSRQWLKNRFLKLVEYKCVECGIGDMYNGKYISLQIDHKNGINNDNRIENLRLLCPNCHSQTDTFSGKRHKKEFVYESDLRRSERIISSRKFNPSKEELQKNVNIMSMVKVGKLYGVSDNAVRKRCKLLKIEY